MTLDLISMSIQRAEEVCTSMNVENDSVSLLLRSLSSSICLQLRVLLDDLGDLQSGST